MNALFLILICTLAQLAAPIAGQSPINDNNTTNTQTTPFYTKVNPLRLTIGLLAPNATPNLRLLMGFGQSVPAINIALERIRAENLTDNVKYSFVWYLGDCNQAQAAGRRSS